MKYGVMVVVSIYVHNHTITITITIIIVIMTSCVMCVLRCIINCASVNAISPVRLVGCACKVCIGSVCGRGCCGGGLGLMFPRLTMKR